MIAQSKPTLIRLPASGISEATTRPVSSSFDSGNRWARERGSELDALRLIREDIAASRRMLRPLRQRALFLD